MNLGQVFACGWDVQALPVEHGEIISRRVHTARPRDYVAPEPGGDFKTLKRQTRADAVMAWLKANPGESARAICGGLGFGRKNGSLTGVITKLYQLGKLRRDGTATFYRYYVTGK